MTTKTITKTNAQWNKILDQLIDRGSAFYEFYGDIECATEQYSPDYEGTITITLTGSDDAWHEFNNLEA